MRQTRTSLVVVTVVALGCLAASPGRASAQSLDEVNATPQGTVGLGLVGAELGLVLPAAAGLREPWAFIVFPALGAGGGAVAGYFLIDEPGHTELSVVALAAGMGLLIPATVLTLSMTSYSPDDEEDPYEARGPASRVATARPSQRLRDGGGGGGMIRVASDAVGLGLPSVGVRSVLNREQQIKYGTRGRSEVQVSLLSGVF